MATLNDIKDSNFLTKQDCEPAIKVTVSHCVEENVAMANQPARMKYVVFFKELQKGMVLNLTNFQRIVALSGVPDTDNWQGVQLTLFNDPTVDFGGKLVGGIRVWVPQTPPVGIESVRQQDHPDHPEPLRSSPGPEKAYRGVGPPPATDDDVPLETGNPDWVGENPPVPPKDNVPY